MAAPRSLATAHAAVTSLATILKMADVGPVAGDVETVVKFLTDAINSDGAEDVARLAKIADALRAVRS